MAWALRELGHDVVEAQEDALGVDEVEGFAGDADLLLWTRTWTSPREEWVAMLRRLETRGVATAGFHLDRWWGLQREHQITDEPFFAVDHLFSADGGHDDEWKAAGIRHHWSPPGIHAPDAVRGNQRQAFRADVVFVGSHPYPHPEWEPVRSAMIDALHRKYRGRFHIWPRPGRAIRGRLLCDLYATAKVVVGDSCLAGGAVSYCSDRIPETLGRAGFLVHPEVEGVTDGTLWSDGDHLVTFPLGDHDEMIDRIDWWLARPEAREQVCSQAQALTLARDTYTHRAAKMLETLWNEGAWWIDDRVGPAMARRDGYSAWFDLRPGDGLVVREVWQQDAYRVRPEHVAGGVVVDLGANVGAFSLIAASMGAARVHAWEPIPANREALLANVGANAGVPVEVHGEAVGASTGSARMRAEGPGSHMDPDGDTEVRTRHPDEILREALAHDGEIAFLKVDVEGGEFDMFDALDPALLAKVRRLAMELHGRGTRTDVPAERVGSLIARLTEWGHLDIMGRASFGGMIYGERW